MRLVILPLSVGLILYFLNIRNDFLLLPVIITATPGAANTPLIAGVYNGDAEGASSLVFLSTLGCTITIPLALQGISGLIGT
jgi:predicted permease